MFCLMSSTAVTGAVTKLANLSQERADEVLSLIEDLAELEALEDAEDLKGAREVLAELRRPSPARPTGGKVEFVNAGTDNVPSEAEPTVPYEQLRRELGLDR
jgi:hypothetical protein